MASGIFSASVEPRFFFFFWIFELPKKVCFEGERWLLAFFSASVGSTCSRPSTSESVAKSGRSFLVRMVN
jgi:hypothetical protein